ncbi:MAG: peptidylprolyl isomerase [Actinomycetota bacterium]
MPRPPKPLVVLTLVAALAVSACSAGPPPAAEVGDDRITDEQLEEGMAVFRFLAGLNGQPCGQVIAGETEQSACARFTLSTMIREDLVKGYARGRGIAVDDGQVAETIAEVRSAVGMDLEAQLQAQGLTEEDLTQIVRRILLFDEVEQALSTTEFGEDEIRQLYEQQRQEFTQIHTRHILLETEAEAVRIANRATSKNFAQLAKRFSIDPGSAPNGGDLGTVAASTFDPDFVEGALALDLGEIGPPVRTRFGWHVILLVSVDVLPFEEVRDQLAGSLQAQVFSDWLRDQLAEVEITVNPRYGRFDPATGDVLPIRSTATTPATPATATATPGSTP